jgi:hypothetical protein
MAIGSTELESVAAEPRSQVSCLNSFGEKLSRLSARLELAEAEIDRLKNPDRQQWISPSEIQRQSLGKYVANQVRREIQKAIDTPADSPLRIGEHFTIDTHEHRRTILVNYPEFDRLMVAEMKAIAAL